MALSVILKSTIICATLLERLSDIFWDAISFCDVTRGRPFIDVYVIAKADLDTKPGMYICGG